MFQAFFRGALLSLLIIGQISCAHQSDVENSHAQERWPSSESANPQIFNERMEVVYKEIMSRENPSQAFVELIERLTRIYFRTTAYIQQFDQELKVVPADQSNVEDLPIMLTSNAYIRIQAARLLMDRALDKISWLYTKLNQDRLVAAQEAAQQKEIHREFQRLSAIRRDLHDSLKALSATPKAYAMEFLTERLLDIYINYSSQVVAAQNSPSLSTQPNNPLTKENQAMLKRLKELKAEMETRLAARDYLRRNAASVQRFVMESAADIELSREVEEGATSLRQEFTQIWNWGRDRQPAQAGKVIYPSTGPSGNIVGRNFPSRTWSLTYDDGPHASRSVEIMSSLEAAGYRGTFFWQGKNLLGSSGQNTVARAKSKRHVLANHSQTHADLKNAGPTLIQNEIVRPHQLMASVYGYAPNIYRCPYGSCTKTTSVREALMNLGYVHAFWAIDTLDWNKSANPNGAESITQRTREQMDRVRQGVILYHDIHPQSVTSSAQVVRLIQARGDRHVDLCRAIDETNGDWTVGQSGRYTFCPYMN